MALHILSAREVQTVGDGDHSDGDGLILRVRKGRPTWVFRYTSPAGRRRDAGFGVAARDTLKAAGESLAVARRKAKAAREALAAGRDPLDEKKARRHADVEKRAEEKRAAKAEALTLCRAARDYFDRAIEGRLNPKTAATWLSSLERNLPSALWVDKPLAQIQAPELFEALAKVKKAKPVTAAKMRRRLSAVFDDARFFGRCAANPAEACRRKLAEVTGKAEVHYRALNFADVPVFVVKLREQKGVAALALEFGLLTAARTAEVLGATWDEIDEPAAIWRVPGVRMKQGEDHVVHLGARALEILKAARPFNSRHLFPSPMKPEKPLSNMGMLTLLKRMGYRSRTTVHGVCRASFSTWAYETNAARPDVIEACLAHKEVDRVKRAYSRTSFDAERAALLRAWADFCGRKKPAALASAPAPAVPLPLAA